MNFEAVALWPPGIVGKPGGFNCAERATAWEEVGRQHCLLNH